MHQILARVDQLPWLAQSFKQGRRHLGSQAVMIVEADAIGNHKRVRLPDVVEQGAPGQGGFPRRVEGIPTLPDSGQIFADGKISPLHAAFLVDIGGKIGEGIGALAINGLVQLMKQEKGVDPDIPFGMIVRRLFHSGEAVDFGQDDGKHAGILEHREGGFGIAAHEHGFQFRRLSLDRHGRSLISHGAQGLPGRVFNREPGSTGKTDRPEEAEFVFAEALLGNADATEQLFLDVADSTRIVDDLL